MGNCGQPGPPRASSPDWSLRLDLINLITAPYDAFNWLTDVLFVFLNQLFGRFGTPIVFVAALAEATVGLGVVFPGVVIMFLGGAAAAKGDSSVTVVFVIATGGTILGDVVSYAAGRWGARFLHQTRLGPSLRLGAVFMDGRARWLIPFYHLHSVTRAVGPLGAGALRMPLRVWVPLDFIGAALANLVWVGSGFVLGSAVLTDEGKLQEHPVLRLGLAAAAVAWVLVMRGMFQHQLRDLHLKEAALATSSEGDPPTRESAS